MSEHIHGGNIYEQHIELDFSANINFQGMPPKVLEAALLGVTASQAYPEPYSRSLKQKLAQRYHLLPANVVCGNGASDVLFAMLHALKPRKAILFTPCFQEYEQALESLGNCEIRKIPLIRENGFLLDENAVKRMLQRATGGEVILVSLPNNPTGLLPTKKALEQLISYVKESDGHLILDLCFWELISEEIREKVLSMEDYPDGDGRILLLSAFTKTYAMPGLRLGFGLCGKESFIRQMEEHMQPWSVSVPAQRAALAACEEPDFLQQSQSAIAKERESLKKGLENLGFQVYPGEANFLFFTGKPGLKEHLLKQNILIRDASNFDGLKDGDYRVCVRSREENQRLLDAIGEWN